jgi:predicted DNA-binding transcriptional regulator AlpA
VSEQITFLKIAAVMQRTGLSKPSIYKLMLHKLFPRPIPIIGEHVGWLESSIDRYNELILERAAPETIKAFVRSAAPPEPERRPRTNRKQSLERVRVRA